MDALVIAQARQLAHLGAWTRVRTSGSVAASTYRTELNITGRGHLLFVALDDSNFSARIRLTIDGVVSDLIGQAGGVYTVGTTSGTQVPTGNMFIFDIPFSTSLVVETNNAHASLARTIVTHVGYILAS